MIYSLLPLRAVVARAHDTFSARQLSLGVSCRLSPLRS